MLYIYEYTTVWAIQLTISQYVYLDKVNLAVIVNNSTIKNIIILLFIMQNIIYLVIFIIFHRYWNSHKYTTRIYYK